MSKDGISEKYKSKASKYYCFNLTGESLLNQIIDNCNDGLFERSHDLVDLESMPDAIPRSNFQGALEEETYFFPTSEQKTEEEIEGPNFLWLAKFCDEEAFKKLWASLAEELKNNIILSKYSYCKGADFLFFFLSQMDREMQRDYLDNQYVSLTVLVTLFFDWLWQDYFMQTFLTISLEKLSNVSSFLFFKMAVIVIDVHGSSKSTETFIKMLHIFNKNYDFPGGDKFFFNKALILLFSDKTMEIFKLLYSLVSHSKKKQHLDSLIDITMVHLEADNFPLLQYIVNQIFETSEEVEEYFLNRDLDFNLIDEASIEPLRSFINMFIFDKEKIQVLKRKSLQHFSAFYINELLKQSKYKDLNIILSFCFSGDEQDILEFKRARLLNSITSTTVFYIIRGRKGKVKGLEELFFFCFGEDEGISFGRNHLMQSRQLLTEIGRNLLLESRREDFDLLDEFLDWCFADYKEGKEAFKNELIADSPCTCFIEF